MQVVPKRDIVVAIHFRDNQTVRHFWAPQPFATAHKTVGFCHPILAARYTHLIWGKGYFSLSVDLRSLATVLTSGDSEGSHKPG